MGVDTMTDDDVDVADDIPTEDDVDKAAKMNNRTNTNEKDKYEHENSNLNNMNNKTQDKHSTIEAEDILINTETSKITQLQQEDINLKASSECINNEQVTEGGTHKEVSEASPDMEAAPDTTVAAVIDHQMSNRNEGMQVSDTSMNKRSSSIKISDQNASSQEDTGADHILQSTLITSTLDITNNYLPNTLNVDSQFLQVPDFLEAAKADSN